MLLPWFGGAASVWITCMLFFQLLLLGGYIYAHWLINNLKPSRQISTHVALLALSILVLPIAPNRHLMSGQSDPSLHLLLLLLTSVGAPYFLLSTTTPLLQSWFSKSYQQAMPYRLFALSNFASLLGLLAYPLIVEPKLTLSQQSNGWSAAYIAFAAACIGTALFGRKARHNGLLRSDMTVRAMEEEPFPPETSEKPHGCCWQHVLRFCCSQQRIT